MPDSLQSGKHWLLQTSDPTMDIPQPDKPENTLHHIYRMDIEKGSVHTWQVKAVRFNIIKTKNFSDTRYGGRDKALQAAIRYRDELLAQIDHFAHQMWIRSAIPSSNTSGISGVTRCELGDKRSPNSRYVGWAAQWTNEHGIHRQRWFSVARYGEHEAKRLAIVERESQLKRVCAAKASHRRDPHYSQKKYQTINPG
jgi:hypothetical protein